MRKLQCSQRTAFNIIIILIIKFYADARYNRGQTA
jgi:hypothetical protein